MIELIPTVTDLPVSDIIVAQRLRPFAEAEVLALVDLIAEFGQTTPILVRRTKKGFVLVDGLHRLEATKRAGLETIPVRAYRMTDEDAQLLETSQNLVGGLSPLDDVVFLAAWKRAHLAKHPDTAQGVAGALAKHGLQANSSSFAEIVASKRAVSVRQVQKIIAAGEKLGPDSARLRHAKKQITLADLIEISKIGQPTERYDVVDALIEGKAKSAADARRAWALKERGGEAPVKDPVEEAFTALAKAWARAGAVSRRRFVTAHFDDLNWMLEDEALERDVAERKREASK
jgi:ParB family transcriptional regulator, chromosome partitioning protein